VVTDVFNTYFKKIQKNKRIQELKVDLYFKINPVRDSISVKK
jgi:N12 class adenine-specific DNA methylase